MYQIRFCVSQLSYLGMFWISTTNNLHVHSEKVRWIVDYSISSFTHCQKLTSTQNYQDGRNSALRLFTAQDVSVVADALSRAPWQTITMDYMGNCLGSLRLLRCCLLSKFDLLKSMRTGTTPPLLRFLEDEVFLMYGTRRLYCHIRQRSTVYQNAI